MEKKSLPPLHEALMAANKYKTKDQADVAIFRMIDMVTIYQFSYEDALWEFYLGPEYIPDLIAYLESD